MRIPSLYKYYQKFFGYPASDNIKKSRNFLFAIIDFMDILKRSIIEGNDNPIIDYYNAPKNHSLVIKFLKNVENLAYLKYDNPLDKIKFYDARIEIPAEYLIKGTRDGVYIPFPYMFDENSNEAILIIFNESRNFIGETSVLLGLISEFHIDKPFIRNATKIIYWNVLNGSERIIEVNDVVPVKREKLINVLNKFIEDRRRK